MGNCQAAEAAAVVIQRPGGGGWTVEKVYWSVPAREVMAANPGHYVAAVTAVTAGPDGAPVRQLKLLRPDDTLTIGHVYRLICFQEVLKELAGKKYAKLKQGRGGGDERRKDRKSEKMGSSSSSVQRRQHGEEGTSRRGERGGDGGGGERGKQRQWKPALHSIAEIGS